MGRLPRCQKKYRSLAKKTPYWYISEQIIPDLDLLNVGWLNLFPGPWCGPIKVSPDNTSLHWLLVTISTIYMSALHPTQVQSTHHNKLNQMIIVDTAVVQSSVQENYKSSDGRWECTW